jgi:hypothetical protein
MAISKSEIQSASIARGVDKITHEVFFVVKSDSFETTWYTVRWNNERLMWCCNCPARCNGCKHVKAVNEFLCIRRASIAAAMGGQVPAIVAKLQRDEDRKNAAAAEDEALRFSPWHGSNRDGDTGQASHRMSREEYVAEFSIY